jgi:hypothetical protein
MHLEVATKSEVTDCIPYGSEWWWKGCAKGKENQSWNANMCALAFLREYRLIEETPRIPKGEGWIECELDSESGPESHTWAESELFAMKLSKAPIPIRQHFVAVERLGVPRMVRICHRE